MCSEQTNRPQAIFLTGRFRSGTTLLWNIFRHIPGCRAFYEPLNDLLPVYLRYGLDVSADHRGVETYWDEYADLRDHVIHLHRTDFAWQKLLLEADDEYPELERYLRFLIDSAAPDVPVLKFCRADFRLPWLRARFPGARIVHIRRESRRQWGSMTKDLPAEEAFDRRTNTRYDLLVWSLAMADPFGFLCRRDVASSYHRHYLLWRLSELMGQRQGDGSVNYDAEVVAAPRAAIVSVLSSAGLPEIDPGPLVELVKPMAPTGTCVLPPGESFEAIEKSCEQLLDRLGLLAGFGSKPLRAIQFLRRGRWRKYGHCSADAAALQAMTAMFVRARSDAAQLSHCRQEALRNAEDPA